MIPTTTIDQLTALFTAVSTLCSDLTDEQWATPTDCPGWDVKDTVSHLIGTERLLQKLPATTHRAADAEHVKNAIGQFNENEIDARRARRGGEVLAEWNDLAALRLATLRAGDDAYFDEPTMTPTGPGTVADFLDVRILDVWSHEQDIRRALHRPGNLDSPAAGHTIDRLLRTLPIVVGKRARCPEGRAVRLIITGPTQRDVTVEVNGGRAGVVGHSEQAPLATITLDTETFVVLALGRASVAVAVAGGSIEVQGDDALGTAVVTQLNMMI